MIKELISLALNNIRRRQLRSWLSIIGICIGISAVVSLISLSQGLNDAISEQFTKIGTDKIIVNNGAAFGPPGALINKLTSHDLNVIEKTRGVATATGVINRFVNVKFNDKTTTLVMNGLSLKKDEYKLIEETRSLEIEDGRKFKQNDKNKVLIGYNLANQDSIFSKKLKLSDKIMINDKSLEVIGVVKKTGSPFEDTNVYLPLETAEEILDISDKYDIIFVRSEIGLIPSKVKEKIEDALRKDRKEKKGEEDFKVQTFESVINTFNSIFSIIQAVVLAIVSISLLVGSIGVMNTMYTAVLERTKEIGIMKAVGAKNIHVLIIFIVESSFLGLIGGVIGILIGFSLSKGAEFFSTYYLGSNLVRTSISYTLIIGVVLFSVILGCISGILPAYQASKLKPVDALRYE